MQLLLNCKAFLHSPPRKTLTFKHLLAMKMLFVLLLAFSLQIAAKGYSQGISLSLKNASLERLFKAVEGQSNFSFVYSKEAMELSKPVTIEVKNESIENVLKLSFANQPLTYSIEENFVIIKIGENKKEVAIFYHDISGRVVNEYGEPMPGVTISVKGSNKFVAANSNGEFVLKDISPNDILVVSGAEMATLEMKVDGQSFINIKVTQKIGALDETIIIGYGTTTRRFSTGSVSKVTAEEISRQPVSNPLGALQGRVPGLTITQTSGYAGGRFDLLLRGQNSIFQNSQPFFVIDGIPYAPQNNSLNQLTNATTAFGTSTTGGISPFSLINPSDIESIEVLKDADATAIYGTRAANGVVLITTKKGKTGKTSVTVNSYTGWSRITRSMDMLNTEQYISMRKEAFANDGLVPTGNNAADILLWDSTRYTDFKKLLLGGTARMYNVYTSISGGAGGTRFLVSGSYDRQGNVLPTNLYDWRTSVHAFVGHTSTDKKFTLNLTNTYTYAKSNLPTVDPSLYINRPPNLKLYDSAGTLAWQEGGVPYSNFGFSDNGNPLATLRTKYTGKNDNLASNLFLSYAIADFIVFKTSFGYNIVTGDETAIYPSTSLDPYNSAQTPRSGFANSKMNAWIAEPQIELFKNWKHSKLNVLFGTTWQENKTNITSISATKYQSDLVLNSLSGAGTVNTTNNFTEYKYNAFFGRLNYNLKDRYILNLTGRRDGSSRFGPGKQFHTFAAIGAAWIFSETKLIKKSLPFISFGKLRGSYGTTGNDGIGDYQFLDTWRSASTTYQGIAIVSPSALFNPELAWESNRKLEMATELGFLNQRLSLSFSYFRNRSSNQLVNYTLPIQTGFNSIVKNQNALVENKGYEAQIESKNIVGKKFYWSSSFNVSISRNKLLKFPGLSTSPYANSLVIGQSLSIRKLYQYLGVDPATGYYTLLDQDRNGIYNQTDRIVMQNLQPDFFGGLQNTLRYNGFELDVFFQFVKQPGINYLANIGAFIPGYTGNNQPVIVLERWRNPDDKSEIQKFTTQLSGPLNQAGNLRNSTAVYGDASFIRCKNLSFSYSFPGGILRKMQLEKLQAYINGQNLFVITRYKGSDPENQNIFRMPPLRTLVVGMRLNF